MEYSVGNQMSNDQMFGLLSLFAGRCFCRL